MSPNFKQAHDSAAENKPFQHYHHSGICTNNMMTMKLIEFYKEVQSLVDQTPKQDILEKMHKKIGEKFMDLSAIQRPMTEGANS